MVRIYDIYGDLLREFPDLDTLAGADLSFQDFRNADFRGMDLTGTDFNGADLECADFEDAIVDGADFYGTCCEYRSTVASGAFRESGIRT